MIGKGSLWALRGALDQKAVKLPDGTYHMKFPWYLIPPGHVPTISGRRLDGDGVFRADANVAMVGSLTVATSSLIFSSLGCWEVTGTYLTSTLTFRVRVRPNPLTG